MTNTCFSQSDAMQQGEAAQESPPSPTSFRTPRSHAFKTGLTYDDPDYQDAYDLTQSEMFMPTSGAEEYDPIVCTKPLEGLLDEYAGAASAFYPLQSEYQRMSELCHGEDGLIHGQFDKQGRFRFNPILEDYADKMKSTEDAYWNALEQLNDALTVEAVVCVKAALALAGVTDDALKDEICRVVLRGGKLWDAKLADKTPKNGQPAKAAPLTPGEKAAPYPLMHRCVTARIEALLMRHAPSVFTRWRDQMTAEGDCPDTNPHWGQLVAYVAAIVPLVKPGESDRLPADSADKRGLADRNLKLLVRLVLKGCRRRGEC